MVLNPILERLAVRKGDGATFVLPDMPFVEFPLRFRQRYPEMTEWAEENREAWQRWRSQVEVRLQDELDNLKSGK